MAGGAGGVSLRAVRQEHTNVAKDRRGAVVPEVLIKLMEGNLIMIMLPCVVSTVRIESTEALTVFFLVTKKRYSMLVTNGFTLIMFMIKSSSLSPLFSHSSTLLQRQLGRPLKQEVNKK